MAIDTCPASVLLIEDSERWRETIGSFLEARGYAMALAEDAEEAFELLQTIQRPCLVLIDLLTLKIDCASLLAMLEPNDRMATLPMVIVSVKAPDLFSRPAAVKRPVDMEIVFRLVKEHCCGGNRVGGAAAGGRELANED
jgi:CheY-like chemotaxis protein